MNKLKKLLQLIDSASLKNQWLLISLGIVSIACCLFSPTVLSVLIAVVISVRIFFTKNKSCYLVFLAFISVMIVRSYFMEQAALTVEQSTITQLVIYPSQAKVNGNQYTGIAYTQQNQAVAFSAVISSEEEKEKLEQLEEPILVTGTFEMIKPEAARNQYGFNYQQFLWSKAIRVQVFIKQVASITKHTSLFSFIEEWKMKLYHHIQHIPYSLVSSYSLALLLGDKSQIDGEALRDFKQLGILHLLVISGLHITIMSQLVLKLLWRIGCPREWSFCIVSVLLVVYGELVNWGVSSTRAILMMVFALMCRLFVWKQVSSMDRFAIVMLITIIVRPTIFLSSSFVLSYGMSGCVLVTSYLFRLWDKNWQTQFSKIIYMSLCSVLLLAPLFFEVNIIAGVLTVICSWGLAVVLLPLLVVNLVGFGIIGELTELLLTMLEQGIHWLNTIQPFRVIIGHGTFYWWGLYSVLLLLLGLFIEQKQPFVKQCACVCSLLFILVMIPYRFGEKVMFIDVGQGDSTLLLEKGFGKTILIDTGGELPKTYQKEWQRKKTITHAERTIIPAIKAQGIREIDEVIITHADLDHIGNLEELAREIKIHNVVVAKGMEQQKIVQTLQQKQVGEYWYFIQAPTTQTIGEFTIHYLMPLHQSSGENKDSVVTYIEFMDKHWLSLGDLDAEGEQQLIKHYPHLQVDILKIAHHGSRFSSTDELLSHYQPSLSIISCGKQNQYHHPHPDTLARLEKYHLNYFRTDEDGAVLVMPQKVQTILSQKKVP